VGPRAEFERLLVEQINSHARWYYCLAYRILRDAPAAEDMCQQAFMAAWERREEIQNPGALRSWLASVVIRQSLQVCRRRKLEQARVRARPWAGVGQGEAHGSFEFDDWLQNALAALPEMTQAVVVMRLVDQLSGNEVKEILGCSVSEVSRRLHAGMEHLRRKLAEVREETERTG
jgi:RNA polymerase sigma-70 factor (ECF subfamily)